MTKKKLSMFMFFFVVICVSVSSEELINEKILYYRDFWGSYSFEITEENEIDSCQRIGFFNSSGEILSVEGYYYNTQILKHRDTFQDQQLVQSRYYDSDGSLLYEYFYERNGENAATISFRSKYRTIEIVRCLDGFEGQMSQSGHIYTLHGKFNSDGRLSSISITGSNEIETSVSVEEFEYSAGGQIVSYRREIDGILWIEHEFFYGADSKIIKYTEYIKDLYAIEKYYTPAGLEIEIKEMLREHDNSEISAAVNRIERREYDYYVRNNLEDGATIIDMFDEMVIKKAWGKSYYFVIPLHFLPPLKPYLGDRVGTSVIF